jgi:hypothetical protein
MERHPSLTLHTTAGVARPLVWFFLVQALWAQSPAGNLPAAALVHIYSARAQHVFISDDGLLLTAYHVVQGAISLDVYTSSGIRCLAPALVAYDEHRDLAELRCKPEQGTILFLQIQENFEPLPLEGGVIYGHPNGKLNQRTPVAFPIERVLRSDHYFVGAGEEIFAEPPQDLIEIQAVLEPGMSGGPVLLQGKALGVVSGSQGPGGLQQGWAIPARLQRGLKAYAWSDFSTLPPVTILKTGRPPTSFLKVAMPEERLRLFAENVPLIESTRSRLREWRNQLPARDNIEALSRELRSKKKVSRADINEIQRRFHALDHTPYVAIDDNSAKGEVAEIYQGLAQSYNNLEPAILQEFSQNRKLEDAIEVRLPKPVFLMRRLHRLSDSSLKDTLVDVDPSLAKAVKGLVELQDLDESWISKAAEFQKSGKEWEALASREGESADILLKTRTGASAAAFITDVMASIDVFLRNSRTMLDLLDVELQVIAKTLELNANPTILESRLENQ